MILMFAPQLLLCLQDQRQGAWLVQMPPASGKATGADTSAPLAVGTLAALKPAAGAHQSPSAESLTDNGLLPAPGDSVRYKTSELMRLAARTLAKNDSPISASRDAAPESASQSRPADVPASVQSSSFFSPVPLSVASSTRSLGSPRDTNIDQTRSPRSSQTSMRLKSARTQDSSPTAQEGAVLSGGPLELPSASVGSAFAVDVAGETSDAMIVSGTLGLPMSSASMDVAEAGGNGQDGPIELSSWHDHVAPPGGSVSDAGSSVTRRRSSRGIPGSLQTIAELDNESDNSK
jgi:hypothetical protein